VRVVVRVLGLLLVPAVRRVACELNPVVVVEGRWAYRGEVAAGTVLWRSVAVCLCFLQSMTYMLGQMLAYLDVGTGCVREGRVPDQILSAVQAAPVPMGSHDSANEVWIVLVRSRVVLEGAGLDDVARSSDRRCGCESD
jgi:hypothetical protein